MKYYLDTEFNEGTQTRRFLGINIGQTKPTIDLISIAVVCEDGREYFALSKDFNLHEAWYKLGTDSGGVVRVAYFWLRENVLKAIYDHYISGDMKNRYPFTIGTMRWLMKVYGKTNQQIGKEIEKFVFFHEEVPQFVGWYADYDWVAFCQLYSTMMYLPTDYPYFCFDLKQHWELIAYITSEQFGKNIHDLPGYPAKPSIEHHALHDARWIRKMDHFLDSIKPLP